MSKKEDKKNEEAKASTNKSSSKKKNLVLMKKGDYSVHVLIEELKNIEQKEEDKLPSPVVKIKCLGQENRSTKPAEDCTAITLNEHFYFEKTNLTVEELDNCKIVLEVYDYKKSKSKEDYFGIYEFDFNYIYNQDNHCIRNYWLALANPESDNLTKIRGYLKLSISVLNDNDPRIELNPKETDANFVLPSQISTECKQVTLNIIRAEGIPDMDSLIERKVNKQCDGYIKVTYMGLNKTTKVVKMQKDIIVWNQAIDIPVNIPVVSSKIVLKVMDKDTLKDDYIGSFEIDVNDIIDNKYKGFQYFNIYGAYTTADDNISKKMNKNPEFGSKWKGKILMKIECKSVETPSLKLRDIEDERFISESQNTSPKNVWNICFKLYDGFYLPDYAKEYSVRVEIQEQALLFSKKKVHKKNIEWGQFKELVLLSYADVPEELPDIFIYLLDGETPVCFQRLSAASLYLNKDTMIIKLIPEPVSKRVDKLYRAGILKIKATVYNKQLCLDKGIALNFLDELKETSLKEKSLDLEDEYADEVASNKKQDNSMETFALVVNVHMSRNLISKDPNGKNDPFLRISCFDQEKETSVRENTVNGIWNEKLIFDNVQFDYNKKATWPILFAKIYDYDKLSSDDIIAYSYIMLSDVTDFKRNSVNMTEPTWFQLYLPKSNQPQGELLLSFNLFDISKYMSANKVVVTPETTLYSFEINVLGLRSLKPRGLFPVKKAFIKFDMNSLNITGGSNESFKPISTQPKSGGSNPNIVTVIKFDLKLPKKKQFMPQLQCEIYDSIMAGMINPLLGIFMLDIESLVEKTEKQISKDLKAIGERTDYLINKSIHGKKLKIGKINVKNLNFGAITKRLNENKKPEEEKNNEILVDEEEEIPKIKPSKSSNEEKSDAALEMVNKKEILVDEDKPKPESVKQFKSYSLDEIERNKDNSEYFVILPVFQKFRIPGSKKREDGTYEEFDIEDTNNIPEDEDFFPLGYIHKREIPPDANARVEDIVKEDPQSDKITKHYRRIYRDELEKIKELKIKSPFNESSISRGVDHEVKDENALFECIANDTYKIIKRYENDNNTKTAKKDKKVEDVESSKTNSMKESSKKAVNLRVKKGAKKSKKKITNNDVGLFKGIIRICEKQKMIEYEKKVEDFKKKYPDKLNELKNLNKYEDLTKRLLVQNKVLIRVYVLELNNLAKKDLLSESDPYIKIYINDDLKVNEAKNRQDDKKNCKWYKYYDMNGTFPGDSTLKIQVWDYDPVFSDELIGETVIDLENRYFSQKWRELSNKPIEIRNIYHPDISTSQGCVYMWLDIFEKEDKNINEPWIIEPEPTTPIQVRLVVWETEDIRCADIEDTSDIYITGYINPSKKQNTDCHYRCQNGNASFNWRMVFDINLPEDNKALYINAYDRDLFKRNDFLGGASLDLKPLYKIAKDINVPIALTKEYVDGIEDGMDKAAFKDIEFEKNSPENKFWITIYSQSTKAGRVLCSLEVMPMWKAELTKVGLGRDEPNIAPFLPPPVGRFEFSLNPFKMINQCVGPKFRRKCYLIICGICLVVYLACIIPSVVLHLTGELANPFNYF